MTSIILQLKNTILKFPQPFVLILVGPPLTGKSTFIKLLDLPEAEVISRDAIILEEYGSNDYTAAFNNVNQKNVDKVLKTRIEEANSNGRNVIIDMTNLTAKRRTYNLSFFGDNYYKAAIIFPILEWEEFQARNTKRQVQENKFIPEFVIKNMINSFAPIKDKEGFNKVISL